MFVWFVCPSVKPDTIQDGRLATVIQNPFLGHNFGLDIDIDLKIGVGRLYLGLKDIIRISRYIADFGNIITNRNNVIFSTNSNLFQT